MGKKKIANKLPSSTDEKPSDDRTTVEARPPSPQQSQPTPTPPIPVMVPLDVLAAYLSLAGGIPAIPTPTPTPEISTTVNPPTTVPTSSTPTSEKTSPTVTSPSETSNPSPTYQQIEPLDASPLSAYKDPDLGETEEKGSKEKEREGGGDKFEETPVAKPIPQEEEREEIDLNETARKQVLMTDDTDKMAEDLDLASQAVVGGEPPRVVDESEGAVHQSVGEVEEKQTEEKVEEKKTEEERPKLATPQLEAKGSEKEAEEKEAELQPEEPKPIVPSVSKPKAVKRRLVLKNDPTAEGQKPKRVSQRCLGRWTSSKAGANTAADAVEISSEDEGATPTKPGEEPLKATNLEDTPTATEMVTPTPNDQEEEADKMAEGLDLASKSDRRQYHYLRGNQAYCPEGAFNISRGEAQGRRR